MDLNKKQRKLEELITGGYEFTGRKYKVLLGENRGKEFPIYAQKDDIAGLVYNDEKDRIELVFKLAMPYKGQKKEAHSMREKGQ